MAGVRALQSHLDAATGEADIQMSTAIEAEGVFRKQGLLAVQAAGREPKCQCAAGKEEFVGMGKFDIVVLTVKDGGRL